MHEDASDTQLLPSPQHDDSTQKKPAWLRCRVCTRRIVLVSDRLSFDGAHCHRFLNPHGVSYEIALYHDAPGCTHEHEASEYFSWFPGFTWRIALCSGCAMHLGWAFECIGTPGVGEPTSFHGLIANRLRAG